MAFAVVSYSSFAKRGTFRILGVYESQKDAEEFFDEEVADYANETGLDGFETTEAEMDHPFESEDEPVLEMTFEDGRNQTVFAVLQTNYHPQKVRMRRRVRVVTPEEQEQEIENDEDILEDEIRRERFGRYIRYYNGKITRWVEVGSQDYLDLVKDHPELRTRQTYDPQEVERQGTSSRDTTYFSE